VRADDLVVPDQELQMDLLRQIEGIHDLVVPEAGPSLVHDLGLDLRDEVARLIVHDREDVALPVGQIAPVVADEQEQVLVRLDRHPRQIQGWLLHLGRERRERIVRRGGGRQGAADLGGVRKARHRRILGAGERQRMAGIEPFLDRHGGDRGVLLVAADPVGARLEEGDRLGRAGALGEVEVLLEEVVVPVDMRDRQDLQAERVVAHQVGEAGV
jgi:hypothetical protein